MTRSRRWHIGFAVLLVNSMAIGPLVVSGLTAISPTVVASLDLSRTQFGALAGVGFATATVLSVTGGRLVDQLGGRRVLGLMSGFAVLAIVTVAAGSDFRSLLVAAALSGVAIALGNPTTNQQVSLHLEKGRRGTVLGLKQSGVPIAQGVVGLLLPSAALTIGWRPAILLLVAFPLLNVLLMVAFAPAGPRVERARTRSLRAPVPSPVWWLAAYALLMGIPLQATNAYLPLFGHEELGLNVAIAGLSMTFVGAVGLLARVYWGRFADRLESPETLLALLALASAVGSLALWGAAQTGARALFWASVAIHGATAVSAIVVTIVVLVQSVDHSIVGRASGVLATGQFAGFALGPVMFGVLIDVTHAYQPGWLGSVTLYLAAAILAASWRRSSSPTTVSGAGTPEVRN